MCVFLLVSVLSCSCSSTTQWRDWGQEWEAWMISNPTLSLPEWTGPNRRCALWDCGNQNCMLGDWLSWMNSPQTGHSNRYKVNTDYAFLHTPLILCTATQSPCTLFLFCFCFFVWNLPSSSITFLVNCSYLYLTEGLLCNLFGAGNT